jgi:hypothetical protein
MKSSSIITSTAVLAVLAVLSAPASAAPVAAAFTMQNAVIKQSVSVAGCANLTTGTSGTATATYFVDNTYSIVRADSVLPIQTGNYAVTSTSSSVTLWMAPDQPSMDAWFGAYNGLDTSNPTAGAMNVNILANCNLKYPSATVSILAPTLVVSKTSLVIKNSTTAGTLTYAVKGLQLNTFKGTPKTGSFKATITMKGFVTVAPSFMM